MTTGLSPSRFTPSAGIVLERSYLFGIGIPAGKRDGAAVGTLERNAAISADHPAAGLAAVSGGKMLAVPGVLGRLAVGSLVEVDGYLDHLVSDDEVAAVPPFPHARRLQLQCRRRGLGRYRVEVVVAHETGLVVLDAARGGVQLDGRSAQHGHALELDEAGVVLA